MAIVYARKVKGSHVGERLNRKKTVGRYSLSHTHSQHASNVFIFGIKSVFHGILFYYTVESSGPRSKWYEPHCAEPPE